MLSCNYASEHKLGEYFFPRHFQIGFSKSIPNISKGFPTCSTFQSIKGFPKGFKVFQKSFKAFQKGFQRVSEGFQSVSKGFPKGFKAFQKGFKVFQKGFQRVSKGFQRVSNPLKPGFQRVSEWPQTPWKTLLWKRSVFVWRVTYARIFVLGYYLFLQAHSFPGATLSENCSLLGTDNIREQISEHVLAPNEGYCLFHLFRSLLLCVLSL